MYEGCYFGEIGCLMGGIRRASIKAESVCELQALSRRNLNVLLSEYPDVADELKQVAKNRANTVKTQNTNGAKATSDSEEHSSSRENTNSIKSQSPNMREITKVAPSIVVDENTSAAPNDSNDHNETNQNSSVNKESVKEQQMTSTIEK